MGRFIVDAEFTKNNWVNVYKGSSEAEAIRIANFWDEKVNVRYIDRVREAAIAQARRDALPAEEKMQADLADFINTKFEDARKKLLLASA